MKEQQDYVRDIAEIRSMMERSSKFLSLSGWAGIMAGIYALAGSYVAWLIFGTAYDRLYLEHLSILGGDNIYADLIFLGAAIIVLAIGTAVWLSAKKAKRRNEKLWNKTSKHLLTSMAVPLVTGGALLLILLRYDSFVILAPCSLIFYGLALFNAGNFTYKEIRTLGYIQILLGLTSFLVLKHGLLFWAFGFGIMHIVYGIYIHYKYER